MTLSRPHDESNDEIRGLWLRGGRYRTILIEDSDQQKYHIIKQRTVPWEQWEPSVNTNVESLTPIQDRPHTLQAFPSKLGTPLTRTSR